MNSKDQIAIFAIRGALRKFTKLDQGYSMPIFGVTKSHQVVNIL
jgi:hypothetical protein